MRNALILSVVFFLLLVFNACEKNNEIIEQKGIDPTEQKILNFKEKMKTHTKSDELVSIDSAVWYIEAALNYTYCYLIPEELPETDAFEVDSFIVNIQTNQNRVNFTEIVDVYNDLQSQALENYNNFNGLNKYLSVMDIELSEDMMSCKTIIQYKFNDEKILLSGWKWGIKLGNCEGQYEGEKDASTEINRYLYRIYPQPAPVSGYWTDITMPYYDGYNGIVLFQNNGPWHSNEQSPTGNNLKIYFESNNLSRCLTLGDSYDWYKSRAWEVVQGAKDYQDDHYEQIGWTDHVMKSWFFTSRKFRFPPPYDEDLHQTHRVEFTYGIFHQGSLPY